MTDKDPIKPEDDEIDDDEPVETKSAPPRQDMKIDPSPLPPRT